MTESDLDLLERANEKVYSRVPLESQVTQRQPTTFDRFVTPLRRRTTRLTSVPHTPLRLLVLKAGLTDDPLACELKRSNLLENPIYDALSYVWGNRQPLSTLNCGGRPFAIRENLRSALIHIRSPLEDKNLWIDAISINQRDDLERGKQVAVMGRIYANARKVLVWLGEKPQEDGSALETIIALSRELPDRQSRPYTGSRYSKKVSVAVRGYNYLDSIRFRHLLGLFSQPWFERVWVIQEVVKAHHPLVHYGKQSVTWDIFAKVFINLNEAYSYLVSTYGADMTEDDIHRASSAIQNLLAINRLREDHQEMSQFAILCVASSFKSTKEKDKLFALLGLGNQANARIEPEYKLTETYFDVFRKHVIFELRERHRIHYLARPPVKEHGVWPSWVPDWTETSRSSYFYTAMGHDFHAAGTTQPELRVSDDETILSISGGIVDTVSYLVPPLERAFVNQLDINNEGTHTPKLLAWLRECMKCVRRDLNLVDKYADSAIMPLLRTLACTGVYGNPSKRDSLGRKPTDYVAGIRHTLVALATALATSPDDQSSMTLLLTEFASKLYPAVAERQFFRTKHGRLGWVSSRARVRDTICVFYGGDVPFALREVKGGCWEIVGECYVDGLMQGEAVQLGEDSRYTFHIS